MKSKQSLFALKVCNVPATFAAAIALLTPRRRLQARLAQLVERKALNLVVVGSSPTVGVLQTPGNICAATPQFAARRPRKMDTLGFEPRAFRMRSGCDTTTPCAQ